MLIITDVPSEETITMTIFFIGLIVAIGFGLKFVDAVASLFD